MATGPTIFHFNCPFCGANPKPVSLDAFLDRWRRSPESDLDALLGLYSRILIEIERSSTTWKTRKFLRALGDLRDWLAQLQVETDPDSPLDAETDSRSMMVDCPLCLTKKGRRPPDRYFVSARESALPPRGPAEGRRGRGGGDVSD